MKLNDFGIDGFVNNIRNWSEVIRDWSEVILKTIHYIILIVAVWSDYWVFISLLDTLENKRKLRAKIKTWGKLNEVSEKLKIEKNLKIWQSLGDSNKKKQNAK